MSFQVPNLINSHHIQGLGRQSLGLENFVSKLVHRPINDPMLLDQSKWTVTGGATVGGGIMTIPTGGSIANTSMTVKAGYTYLLTLAHAGGSILYDFASNPFAPFTFLSNEEYITAGPTPSAGLILTPGGGTPVIQAPFNLIEIHPLAFAIHPDPMNRGGGYPNGLYDPNKIRSGYPIWPGDGTITIRTAGNGGGGNGTGTLDPAQNGGIGVLGVVPGQNYRIGWSAISNPSNTTFQIDMGTTVEGNTGEPLFVDLPFVGGVPNEPNLVGYIGDTNTSGGVEGLITFTGPMTIQWLAP